jgi:hypothetical protein
MSLIKGQIIEVRTRGDRGGWSVGLHGAFPTDFVEFLPASTGANDPFMGLSADPMPTTQTQVASNTHVATASSTQSSTPHISQSSTAPTSTFIPPPPPKKNTNPAQTASVSTAVPASATPTNPKKDSNPVPPPPTRTSATTAATAPSLQSSQPVAANSTPPSSANAVSKPPGSTAKAIEPQGFQKVERHRPSLVAENKETTLNPLDGTSFVLTPGTLSSPNAVWRQYLYMDLFADCHVRQMADPRNHVRSSTATSRVVVAMNTIQKGLQYIDLVTYPTTVEVDLIRDVRETLLNTMKVSLDLCSRIPPRTSEPSKMFTFLATLMMRIAKMSIGDYLMFPVSWQNTTIFKSETELAEHAVLIILRRINRDTTSDFSVTIVNTSVDEGLCFHAMKGNDSDASILYNMSFTIPQVETARVSSSTFW